MFAVPGWSSLSAATPKTQTTATSKKSDSKAKHAESAAKQNKKRKRSDDGPDEVDPSSVNLGDMWEKVVEGKSKPKSKSKGADKSEKRQKVAEGEQQHDQAPDADKPEPTAEELERIDKKRVKRKEKRERLRASKEAAQNTAEPSETTPAPPTAAPPSKAGPALTPLQASMRQKLVSARFRHLNQTLYTTPSAHSLSLFKENPEMFQEYHEGFRRQVEVWPENPVDGYVAQIRARGKQRGPAKSKSKDPSKSKDSQEDSDVVPLPRTEGTCYIADLGCGDAALSTNLQSDKKKLKLEIFSYDLQSPSPLVTIADIANLPLKDNSVDVAIFCLALMGTNWIDFIEEAYRILHWKGELWISEIKSRFGRVSNSKKRVDHSVGNRVKKPDKKTLKKIEEVENDKGLMVEVDGNADNSQETDVSAFVEVLRKRGFVLRDEGKAGVTASIDLSNRMFVRMVFVKGATPIKGKGVPIPKGMPAEQSWKPKMKKKFIEDAEEDDTHVSLEAGS